MSTKKSFATKGVRFVALWLIIIYGLTLFWPQKNYFPFSYEQESITVSGPARLWHLANFDGVHYQNIASGGYLTRFQTAFFPFYPLLIKSIGFFLGGNFLLAGLVISFLSTLGSLYLLFRLSRSTTSAYWLIAFPTAFFLLASYTESLFLLLSLLTWWFYKKKHLMLAGLFGLLASLTRFQGILLLPVLLLDYCRDKSRPKQLLPLLFIPVGLLLYMAFLNFSYHDALYFYHAQSFWNRSSLTFPLQTVYRYIKIIVSVSPTLAVYWVAILELAAFLLAFFASLFLFFRRQFSFAFYLFLGLLLPALTGSLISFPRHLLVLFPLYLIPEMIKTGTVLKFAILAVGLIIQLVLFTAFLNGTFVG